MKKTTAKLHASLLVECPHCEADLDLMDHASGYNDESEMTQAAFPDASVWSDEHRNFEQEIVCPASGETYSTKGIDW